MPKLLTFFFFFSTKSPSPVSFLLGDTTEAFVCLSQTGNCRQVLFPDQ